MDAGDEGFVDVAGTVSGQLLDVRGGSLIDKGGGEVDGQRGSHQSIRARGGRWTRGRSALHRVRLFLGGRCRLRQEGVLLSM